MHEYSLKEFCLLLSNPLLPPGPCQRLSTGSFCLLLFQQDIQQLLQLQQLVLVPGHPLPSPAQFLLPQAQQGQQGGAVPAPNPSSAFRMWLIQFRQFWFVFRTPLNTKSYSATSAKPGEPAVGSWPNGAPITGMEETFITRRVENEKLSAALSSLFSAVFSLSFPHGSETRARR